MLRLGSGSRPGAVFHDRAEAGRCLAGELSGFGGEHPVVLGLPRGGVAVAAGVARALGAALDVALVRKLGVPYQPELAVGALGEGGVRVINEDVRRAANVSDNDLAIVEGRARAELERQAHVFRGGRPPLEVTGRTVIVVDDGIATGSTARAACQIARARGAARVVLATPVAPASSLASLACVADEVVVVQTPEPFFAIGQWYDDFSQLSDDAVISLLRGPRSEARQEVNVPVAPGKSLPGSLVVPQDAQAMIVFAHGSGSSRVSPRNLQVAARLWEAGMATLLFDLLDTEEAGDPQRIFDIELLGSRLSATIAWAVTLDDVAGLPVGAFGASTGAGAALWAAAETSTPIRAVVSRGGRPDLAGGRLARVTCPTLLIVGGLDPVVLELNRRSLPALRGIARLVVVPGATHLFEEHGALGEVAGQAAAWFRDHLVTAPADGDAPRPSDPPLPGL